MTRPILEVTPRFAIGLAGKQPWITAESFTLPEPGVYTLEGPNGSGKSMLVALLTGTLPNAVDSQDSPKIFVDGKVAKIQSYRDALRAGIVAVFQDDDMVSSMTGSQYLELVHDRVRLVHIIHHAYRITYNYLMGGAKRYRDFLEPLISKRVRRLVAALEPKEVDWHSRKVIAGRAQRLLDKYNLPHDLVDKVPTRMSPGGRAALRFISAELHDHVRVLILDEALNGVERNIWPRFVDHVKEWSERNGVAVLAISHNSEELVRWEPRARLVIRNGDLVVDQVFDPKILRRIYARSSVTAPILELTAASDRLGAESARHVVSEFSDRSQYIVLCTSDDQSLVEQYVVPTLPAGSTLVSVVGPKSDVGTSDGFYLLHKISAASRDADDALLIVAGDEMLISMYALVALTNEASLSDAVVFLPLSFHDAVRAVLFDTRSAELATDGGGHRLRLSGRFVPTGFLFSVDLFRVSDPDDIRDGLAECLKLGLLFSPKLFDLSATAIGKGAPGYETSREVFRCATSVVNEVIGADPTGRGFDILTFSEPFAQVFVRAGLRRGKAVLLGIAFELVLAGQRDESSHVLDEVVRVCQSWSVRLPCQITDADFIEPNTDHLGEIPGDGAHYRVLGLQRVGEFEIPTLRNSLAIRPGDKSADLAAMARVRAEEIRVVQSRDMVKAALSRLGQALEGRRASV